MCAPLNTSQNCNIIILWFGGVFNIVDIHLYKDDQLPEGDSSTPVFLLIILLLNEVKLFVSLFAKKQNKNQSKSWGYYVGCIPHKCW